jgi:hypothetical protein
MATKTIGVMTIWLMSAATAGPALARRAGPDPAKAKGQLVAADEGNGTRFSDVSVKTANGVVRLTGSVPDEEALKQILRVARSTAGTMRIENDLTIAPKRR